MTNTKKAAKSDQTGATSAAQDNVPEAPIPFPQPTLSAGLGTRLSPLEETTRKMSERTAMKVTTLQEAAQLLAEAKDLYNEGASSAKDAAKVANRAALLIVQSRAIGALTVADVNAKLGDIFGYKPKSGKGDLPLPANHPDAGKTPHGQGEVIRKRIVRAVQAVQFVEGNIDDTPFFAGLSPNSTDKDDNFTLEGVVTAMMEGKLPIFTAYDRMSAIKSAGRTRLDSAFDPKAIAKIVASLSGAAAVEAWLGSPALREEYATLLAVISEVDNAAKTWLMDKEYAANAIAANG